MLVHIPSPLLSYTAQQREVRAEGTTVDALLRDLERQFPGIRFRMIDEQDAIRRHIRIFVNGDVQQTIAAPLAATDTVHIICAISGG